MENINKKWEYKIVSPNLFLGSNPFDDDEELSPEHLNVLGEQGWELVAVVPKTELGLSSIDSKNPKVPLVFIFKK